MRSRHMKTRMSQRGISNEAVASCLQYGRRKHLGRGMLQYFLGHKEVLYYEETEGVHLRPHQGICVIVTMEGTLVTSFRRQKAPRGKQNRRRTEYLGRKAQVELQRITSMASGPIYTLQGGVL